MAPAHLQHALDQLLRLKRSTDELGLGDPIPGIGEFIQSELVRHGDGFSGAGRPELNDAHAIRRELNEIFRESIRDERRITGQTITRTEN